jgi:hypothetical protein
MLTSASKGNARVLIGAAIVWQTVLVWRGINSDNPNPKMCDHGVKALYVTTLIQPLIFALAATYTSRRWVLGAIISGLYAVYAIYAGTFVNQSDLSCDAVKPTKDCPHIRFDWWKKTPYQSWIYLLTVAITFVLLLRTIQLSVKLGLFLIVSLMLSLKFYPCAPGSLWCWFSASAPIYTMMVV